MNIKFFYKSLNNLMNFLAYLPFHENDLLKIGNFMVDGIGAPGA
jgi:hypothetical protein